MKKEERRIALVAALIFTVVGFLQIDQSEDLVLATLSFIAAAMFFYQAFGKDVIRSCTFSALHDESKNIVVGDDKALINRNQAMKVALVTFLAVVVSFGIGFGVGKLIYHFIH